MYTQNGVNPGINLQGYTATDETSQTLYLYGGLSTPGSLVTSVNHNETRMWKYDVVSSTWQQLWQYQSTPGPVVRSGTQPGSRFGVSDLGAC